LQSNTSKQRGMKRMVELAYTLYNELQNNNTDAFGEILHENWMLKKSMADGVSNGEIDEWYESARAKRGRSAANCSAPAPVVS
jgi:D-glycero-alpha-D-manno-heptose-7-phosphate kinase